MSEPLSGGSVLGDALRALVRLRPTNDATAAAILELLRLRTITSPGSAAAVRPAAVDLPQDEPDEPGGHDAMRLRLVSDTDRLPPIVPTEIEEIGDTGAKPPEWLDSTPPIALPTTIANPFR